MEQKQDFSRIKEVLNKVLGHLVDNKDWNIVLEDANTFSWCDKFYVLEYSLRTMKDGWHYLRLSQWCVGDREALAEQIQWKTRNVRPEEIQYNIDFKEFNEKWKNYMSTPLEALDNILKDETVCKDIPIDMIDEMKCLSKQSIV
jgi:hypothetical protein